MKKIICNLFSSLVVILGAINFVVAQEDDFVQVEDSLIVKLGLQFGSTNIGVFIYDLQPELLNAGLMIQDLSRPSSGGEHIIGSQFSVTMSSSYKLSDTFAIVLLQTEFDYPPVVFTLSSQFQKINIGADCYLLDCIPDSDPWMPTALAPFIIAKNECYINPKNGKIKKGNSIIRSGRYTACDLKDWRIISPFGYYYDNKGSKHLGSDLINNKKIKLEEWDLKQFDAYFFR